jgi:hypothetical protein
MSLEQHPVRQNPAINSVSILRPRRLVLPALTALSLALIACMPPTAPAREPATPVPVSTSVPTRETRPTPKPRAEATPNPTRQAYDRRGRALPKGTSVVAYKRITEGRDGTYSPSRLVTATADPRTPPNYDRSHKRPEVVIPGRSTPPEPASYSITIEQCFPVLDKDGVESRTELTCWVSTIAVSEAVYNKYVTGQIVSSGIVLEGQLVTDSYSVVVTRPAY